MKIKTYKASSVVAIGRKCGRIMFMPSTKGGSYYITSCESEQEAIERNHMYKSGRIVLSETVEAELDVESSTSVEVVSDTSEVVYDTVTKCVDAISVLREYGVEGTLNSKAKILEAAASVNVAFPNL